MNPADESSAIRPAATAIVMRERSGDAPELLMIRRSSALVFADAWVFPGGQVDAEDQSLAADYVGDDLDLDEAANRIAAIRETIEEAGCPIGLDPVPDPATLAAIRAGLHAGRPLATLMADHALDLALDQLVPFSRWITPPGRHKRYDTRFYLSRATGEAICDADGTETVATAWITAQEMLETGAGNLMFPTALALHRLALHADYDSAAAHSLLQPRDPVKPQILEVEGERFLTVPEGWGFPDVRFPVSGRR